MGYESSAGRGTVQTHYGPRAINETNGGVVQNGDKVKTITYKFSYDDLPGGGTDALRAYIPAGGMLVNAYWITTTAFAGGTSYDVGLEQSDGSTAIDADGIFDALVLADIDASAGALLSASEHAGTNSGAAIGLKLSNDGYLVVAATGTFTAGEAELILEYVQ